MGGNLCFKINWASLIVWFTLYLRAIFQVQAPGALIFGGAINGGFLRYQFGGLIHGAAYFWNFTVF